MMAPYLEFANHGKIRTAVLIGLLSLFLLSPALRTGYYAEDHAHSNVRGLLRWQNIGLLEYVKKYSGEALAFGRFYPVTPVLIRVVHYLTQDALTYKAVLLAGTVVELVLFFLLVARWTSTGFAGLATLLVAGLYQFRLSPDPLLGYYLQIQIVGIALFGSLLALDLWLDGHGRHWQVWSLLLFALALLTYENSAPFLAVYVLVIAWHQSSWRARFISAVPFLLLAGAWVAITYYVRSQRLQSLDLYIHHPSLEPVAYVEALLKQISAALPFSYYLFDPHDQFRDFPTGMELVSWLLRHRFFWLVLGLVAPFFWFVSRAVRGATAPAPRFWVLTLSVGLLLVVLPTILVAASPFHQNELGWGSGWVSVLIQVHGSALILATATWQLLAWGTWEKGLVAKRVVAGSIVTAAIVFTHAANVDFVTNLPHQPISCSGSRANVEEALARGLLQDVPEHSPIVLANEYGGWFCRNEQYPGLTATDMFFLAKVPQLLQPVNATVCPPEVLRSPHYRFTDVCLDDTRGYVLLTHWTETGDPKRLNEVRVYINSRQLFQASDGKLSFLLVENVVNSNGTWATDHILRRADRFRRVCSGPDWGIFTISNVECVADAERLRIVLDGRELFLPCTTEPCLPTAGAAMPPKLDSRQEQLGANVP